MRRPFVPERIVGLSEKGSHTTAIETELEPRWLLYLPSKSYERQYLGISEHLSALDVGLLLVPTPELRGKRTAGNVKLLLPPRQSRGLSCWARARPE
jgi:hypothetical protein